MNLKLKKSLYLLCFIQYCFFIKQLVTENFQAQMQGNIPPILKKESKKILLRVVVLLLMTFLEVKKVVFLILQVLMNYGEPHLT